MQKDFDVWNNKKKELDDADFIRVKEKLEALLELSLKLSPKPKLRIGG